MLVSLTVPRQSSSVPRAQFLLPAGTLLGIAVIAASSFSSNMSRAS